MPGDHTAIKAKSSLHCYGRRPSFRHPEVAVPLALVRTKIFKKESLVPTEDTHKAQAYDHGL